MKLNIKNQRVYLIVLIGFILRLVAFPFAQVTDADAVSRIFLSESWLAHPHLIYEGVWLPLHYYFNAIAIALFGEHVIVPILFHIILTCLTAIPLYHFTKREFSEKGAWFSAAFYLLCPLVFRNSFHTLSGLPYAFFVALALNCISKSIRNKDYKQALYAGVYMTLASGFRYEAWLLIAIFTGIYMLFKAWKHSLYFWVAAMVFPTFWMIGNYLAHGDILYGLTGAYNWNINMEGVNDQVDIVEIVKRLIYFPLSWVFLFSPILVGLVGWKIVKKIKNKELIKERLIWSIPFWIVFIVFIYKASEGTLLLQHRFTISLILLSAPFTAIIFEKTPWNKTKKAGIVLILALLLPLSYVWMRIPVEKLFKFSYTLDTALGEIRTDSKNTFEAIPRLSNQNYVFYSKEINKKLTKESGLILDFFSWDNTLFLSLNANLPAKNVFIVNGSTHGKVDKERLQKILNNYPKGVIMLKCYSKFSEHYQLNKNTLTFNLATPLYLKLTPIGGEIGIGIFEYEIVNSPEVQECNNCFYCPELNSLEHLIIKIKDNEDWANDIRQKAIENGVSFEQQLSTDAQWILDNTKTQEE